MLDAVIEVTIIELTRTSYIYVVLRVTSPTCIPKRLFKAMP